MNTQLRQPYPQLEKNPKITDRDVGLEAAIQEDQWHAGAAAHTVVTEYEAMSASIRSEGKWWLGWGVFNLLFASFSSPFGLVLLGVGLATRYLRSAAFFPLFAVIFALATINNIIVGGTVAIGFAIVMASMTFLALKRFRHYRQVERAVANEAGNLAADTHQAYMRAKRLFPWAGFLFSITSVAGFVITFVAAVWIGVTAGIEVPAYLIFLYDSVIQIGNLALGISLASPLCRYRYPLLSLAGAAAASLTIVGNIILVLTN